MMTRPLTPLPSRRMPRRLRSFVALAAIAALTGAAQRPAAATAESLEGVVELTENGRPVPGAAGAVVSFEPEHEAPRPSPRPAEIVTRDKRFLPRVTVVPRGSSVGFPNRDPIFHNVFSVSQGNRFDLGRYREGQSRSTRFDEPGLVRVYCNVHEQMVAYVLVVDTPHHALAGEDGRFRLDGVPAGRGTLAIWHERAGTLRVPVEVPRAEPIRIRLQASPLQDPHHLNKFGRPYGSDAPDGVYR